MLEMDMKLHMFNEINKIYLNFYSVSQHTP